MVLSIPIQALSETAVVMAFDLQGSDLEWTDQGSTLEKPVRCELKVRRIEQQIRIEGSLSTLISSPCARCLEAAYLEIDDTFTYELDLKATSDSVEDFDPLIHQVNDEGSLDLRMVIKERLHLNIPLRILCRQDCLGLCPVCGINRNTESCGCNATFLDPRFAVLKHMKLKE